VVISGSRVSNLDSSQSAVPCVRVHSGTNHVARKRKASAEEEAEELRQARLAAQQPIRTGLPAEGTYEAPEGPDAEQATAAFVNKIHSLPIDQARRVMEQALLSQRVASGTMSVRDRELLSRLQADSRY
jgi:hypothetical protein